MSSEVTKGFSPVDDDLLQPITHDVIVATIEQLKSYDFSSSFVWVSKSYGIKIMVKRKPYNMVKRLKKLKYN